MLVLPESRWKAFSVHLSVSFAIFLALAGVIYFLWYPAFLFATEGGWQGIRLIAGVDLVIGPLLTLLVYNKAKKSIRFDLSVIAALQVLCIVGGMATVWYSKPVVVAYADGTFYTANREKFRYAEIDMEEVALLQNRKPVWLNIEMPGGVEERREVLAMWNFSRPISIAHELYQPYEKAVELFRDEGLTAEQAKEQWGVSYPNATEGSEIRLFRLESRFQSRYVAMNIVTGKFVELI